MERDLYFSQLYLPHYFIQEENVSTKLDDMDISKPVRLQNYSYDAHKVLFDNILTSEDIKYIQKLYNI